MGQFFLLLIAALVVGAIVFGVAVLITGDDPGIDDYEPDGRAVPLPSTRPLGEGDVVLLRFDTVIRGYRMGQVDAAFRRAAYDIGYKEELIQVLEAEINALREGRTEEADALREARQAAISGAGGSAVTLSPSAEESDNKDESDKSDRTDEAEQAAAGTAGADAEPVADSTETAGTETGAAAAEDGDEDGAEGPDSAARGIEPDGSRLGSTVVQ
jgi:hypothetical protein